MGLDMHQKNYVKREIFYFECVSMFWKLFHAYSSTSLYVSDFVMGTRSMQVELGDSPAASVPEGPGLCRGHTQWALA